MAIPAGMVLLVTHRLVLMRRHWAMLALSAVENAHHNDRGVGHRKTPTPGARSSDESTAGRSSVAEDTTAGTFPEITSTCASMRDLAVSGVADDRDISSRVVEPGVSLLALEMVATAWVASGYSSAVALRFGWVVSFHGSFSIGVRV